MHRFHLEPPVRSDIGPTQQWLQSKFRNGSLWVFGSNMSLQMSFGFELLKTQVRNVGTAEDKDEQVKL